MRGELVILLITAVLIAGCVSIGDDDEDRDDLVRILEISSMKKGVGSINETFFRLDPIFEKELTDEEKDKLEFDDNDTFTIASWETHGHGGHPYIRANFTVEEDIVDITVTWQGSSSQPWIPNSNVTYMYFYDWDERKWDSQAKWWRDENMDEEMSNASIGSQKVDKYTSNGGILSVLIWGPYGEGNSSAALTSDMLIAKGWI
jgi:hypothetical protein